MNEVRLILADDHTLVRAGLRALLESLPGVSVVAEAGDGHGALALLESEQPDLALLDLRMPGLNGLEVIERARKSCPRVRIIVLSMHAAESYVSAALRAGAAGYLLKEGAVEELPAAIDAVLAGETYLSPSLSKRVVSGFLDRAPEAEGPLDQLTPRQREILQLIAEGLNTKEIGARLGISSKTVDIHRSRLMERLGIHDIASLVRVAIRAGLIDPE